MHKYAHALAFSSILATACHTGGGCNLIRKIVSTESNSTVNIYIIILTPVNNLFEY